MLRSLQIYIMLEPVVSLYSAGNKLGKESAVSPGGVKDIPGDLHLLSGPFVQVLQGASQRPLDRRHPRPLHARARRLPWPSGAAEHREPGGNAAAGGTGPRPSEPAAEYLGEDLLGAPGVEAEPVEAGAGAGSVRGGGRRGRAGPEAFLAVLVVDGALLRVAEHLREGEPRPIEREVKQMGFPGGNGG